MKVKVRRKDSTSNSQSSMTKRVDGVQPDVVEDKKITELEPKRIALAKIGEENYLLDKVTSELFPESGEWWSSCFNRPKTLALSNLPCHLRDDMWLTQYLLNKVNRISISPLTKTQVYDYVRTSLYFNQERNAYEQRIVEWQIKWVLNGGGNYSLPTGMDDDERLNMMPDCDIYFRKIIMKTLMNIGMNRIAIEEGLEKNSHLWREEYMEMAYNIRYNCCGFEDTMIMLPPTDEEHKKNWLAMREYEYYQDHKKV
ncbi:MAG: hypothetical protein ACI4PF_00410 [Christensenellales bacterium]